jgi:hypothetical protein
MTEIIDPDRHFSHRDLSRVDGKIQPRRLGNRAAVRREDPCGEYLRSNAGCRGIEAGHRNANGLAQGIVDRAGLLNAVRLCASRTVALNARSRRRCHAPDGMAKLPHALKPRAPSRRAGGSHVAIGATGSAGDLAAGPSGARQPFGAAARSLNHATPRDHRLG